MKMLLICPKFYDYHRIILDSAKNIFGTNYFIPDDEYINDVLSTHDDHYDRVLIIRGFYLSAESLRKLGMTAKNLVSYQWDSVENNANALLIKSYADKSFSFDPNDCRDYGFLYKPLFYVNNTYEKHMKKWDVFFLGKLHSNRLKVLDEFYRRNPHLKLKIQIQLTVKRFFILLFTRPILAMKRFDWFIFEFIAYEKYLKELCQSRYILDLSHEKQSGFSMRTIEALGNGCRVITTNQAVNLDWALPAEGVVHYLDSLEFFFDDQNQELNSFVPELEISNWLKDFF